MVKYHALCCQEVEFLYLKDCKNVFLHKVGTIDANLSAIKKTSVWIAFINWPETRKKFVRYQLDVLLNDFI